MASTVGSPSRSGAVVACRVALVLFGFAAQSALAATLSGPITGGERGRPFTAAVVDLAAHGYIEEEYFLAGTATTYAPARGTALGSDGRWRVVPAGSADFATRILVRRPTDGRRFNGTVLVEWLNVTGGFDIDAVWARVSSEALRSGYAWVGVSAQRASVNGPPVLPGVSDPLTAWDPERYGDLVIADDASSYDIFSQAAAAVARDRARAPVDPMGGLPVRRLLAIGASQSAHRLASYYDGIHPLVRAYDGFLVVGRFGRGAALAPEGESPSALRMRTDLDTPVMTVNSESEALAHFAARQADTDTLRYWEVAGAAHQDTYVDAVISAEIERDLGFPLPPCDPAANSMPFQYVLEAALDHLNRWVGKRAERLRLPPDLRSGPGPAARARVIRGARSSAAPPRFPPIAVAEDGAGSLEIERDRFGNALGGIRLPQIRVPTAQYGPVGSPEALRCDLRGFTIPFDQATLASLYPDHATYVRRVEAATSSALRAGFVLAPHARAIRIDAAAAPIP
jgi:hypothetical protein